MKIFNLKGFHVDTPKLTSIPPKEKELKKIKDFHDKISLEGKKLITVCCTSTVKILNGALKLGVTEADLNLFKNSFHRHPLSGFGGNKYRIPKSLSIEVENLIDDIFETSTLFSNHELSEYFLDSIYFDAQERNKNPMWTKELLKFNKLFNSKKEGIEVKKAQVVIPKKEIKFAISKIEMGEVEIALRLLLNFEVPLEIKVLSSHFFELKRDYAKGIIKYEDYIFNRDKVVHELLSFLS